MNTYDEDDDDDDDDKKNNVGAWVMMMMSTDDYADEDIADLVDSIEWNQFISLSMQRAHTDGISRCAIAIANGCI